MPKYDTSDPLSIFSHSGGLLGHTLAQAVAAVDPSVDLNAIEHDGKGGLGQLVEKYYFGYEPNSSPEPDFPEAGVELKVSPLKKGSKNKYIIKERLVCDMIDYFTLVEEQFEDSRFFRKSALMLIIFYLHTTGCKRRDLKFIYSVLWQIKDKDLLIIKEDFKIIRDKVRRGLAHELSEGDTMYLGACRKGQKGQVPRKQPFSEIQANARAFSLKPSYMRTILDFVQNSGKNMVSNLSTTEMPGIELVTASELMSETFDMILQRRFEPFMGMDYKQIAHALQIRIKRADKSRYANVVRHILHPRGLASEQDAEELRKAGIKIKTIRLQKNGKVKEHMSFEQIDYKEVLETENWVDSKWYEIITTRYLFVVFREVDNCVWDDEARYILDKMFFWTMPPDDYAQAEQFWNNIKRNVVNDTLMDRDSPYGSNTFWTLKDKRYFHVRPKARNSADATVSPVSNRSVPKKAYWIDNRYLRKEIRTAYGKEWECIFNNKHNE